MTPCGIIGAIVVTAFALVACDVADPLPPDEYVPSPPDVAQRLREGKYGNDLGYARPERPMCLGDAPLACSLIEAESARTFEAAMSGDLAAQERLVELFENRDLIQRPVQVCAWRLVIAARTDHANPQAAEAAEAACALESGRDRRGAQWLANDIHQHLYETELPDRFW